MFREFALPENCAIMSQSGIWKKPTSLRRRNASHGPYLSFCRTRSLNGSSPRRWSTTLSSRPARPSSPHSPSIRRGASLATAETADGTWTFKRVGFLNPRVTIRAAGSPDNLAVYQPKFWGDGTVTFADGAAFRWQPTNFWATEWAFTGASDLSSGPVQVRGGKNQSCRTSSRPRLWWKWNPKNRSNPLSRCSSPWACT